MAFIMIKLSGNFTLPDQWCLKRLCDYCFIEQLRVSSTETVPKGF